MSQEQWLLLVLGGYLVPGLVMGAITAIKLSRSPATENRAFRPHVRQAGFVAILLLVFAWPLLLMWLTRGPKR